MLASQDEAPIADHELLTETGSGGMFASGYLRDRPLIEYLGGSERVAFLLSNKKRGVRRESDENATVYQPGDGYRAMLAVTDTRVLFVVGDGDEDGDLKIAIPYTEVEDVKTDSGVLTKHIDVWTTEGVRWRFFVRNSVEIEPAAGFLERAAVVWSRVERQLRHARLRLVDVDDCLEKGDHDGATAAVERARDHVDEAQRKAVELTADRDDVVWERIHEVDWRVDRCEMNVHVARAEQLAGTAGRQWREERYHEAYDSFLAARNEYERALDVAREREFPEADEIRDEADAIMRNLDQLSKSPLRHAEETHERAADIEDPGQRAEVLEEAIEKYRTAMTLDWGHDNPRFAGDTGEIRGRIEEIVADTVAARRTAADRHRSEGDTHLEDLRCAATREAYARARDELERALDLAEELKPDLAPDLRAELEALAEAEAEAREETGGFRFVGDQGRE